MSSPARAHFQRVSAAEASASAGAGQPLECTEYELMLLKLAEDRRRLKTVQSVELKAEVKRQLLPEYAAWVDGVLLAGRGAQDDVLMTVMVWRIDAGDYDGALLIAEYAIAHQLTMPDQYQRSTATLIAEEVADRAQSALEANAPIGFDVLAEVLALTADQDMPDQVRAKLLKAHGRTLMWNTAPDDISGPMLARRQLALDDLRRALSLNKAAGVKKDIEKLERELKNAAAALQGGS